MQVIVTPSKHATLRQKVRHCTNKTLNKLLQNQRISGACTWASVDAKSLVKQVGNIARANLYCRIHYSHDVHSMAIVLYRKNPNNKAEV